MPGLVVFVLGREWWVESRSVDGSNALKKWLDGLGVSMKCEVAESCSRDDAWGLSGGCGVDRIRAGCAA